MCRFEKSRRLPAIAVLAATLAATQSVSAQTPTVVPVSVTQAQQAATPLQDPPTPEQIGDALMAHQRYQAAIEAFKKAPRESADAWNKMGIAYQLMFNPSEAIRCYEISLKLRPKSASVLNNVGTVYDSLKQYSAAEKMYRKALKLDPKSALILKNLGTDLLAQHKYKKGEEVYRAAAAADPQIFERSTGLRVDEPATIQERGAMNYYMARSCVHAGMNERAIEYLRLALNEGFTNPKKIIADTEFAGLRGNPAFENMLAAQHSLQRQE